MDRLTTYHQAIVAEMEYQASIPISNRPDTQRHLIIDPERRRYALFNLGWDGNDFIHGLLFHLELKADGMIWLHANFTDIEISRNLIERGVDPKHIEISWIEPALRRLMEAAKEGR